MITAGVKTRRTFTCTRCAVEAVLEGTSDQPKGWVGVVFVTPPLANFDDVRRQLLCTECETAFADFMFSVKKVQR